MNIKKRDNLFLYILVFTLPVLLCCIAFAMNGVFPFGDKSVLLWDLELQHKDYYSYIWDVLHGNASIQYSFGKSLGGRMIGVIAFYVSSIMNIGLIFVQKAQIAAYLSVMTLIKVGFCGLTAGIYLNKRFGIRKLFIVCMAVSYALMEYNMVYCRNLMWLDGVIMLPLVCLGVHRAISEKKGGLLVASAAIAIICNWYTGYMVCLMSGIYFLYEMIFMEKISLIKDTKNFLRKTGSYLLYLMLGVMGSAAVLLPSCISLLGGKATNNLAGLTFSQNMSFLDVIAGYSLAAPSNKQTAAILYCGGFLLLAVIYGLLLKNIKFRDKLDMGLILLLIYASFSFSDLELLWTAFVKSTSYYFRFSFVAGFVMLLLAAQVIKKMEKESITPSWKTGIPAIILAALIIERGALMDGKKTMFSIALLVLYFAIVFALNVKRPEKFSGRAFSAVLCCLLVLSLSGELAYNAKLAFKDYKNSESEYENYTNSMQAVLDEIDGQDDSDFYRLEKTYSYLNITRGESKIATGESLQFGYNSIEHYSSAYDILSDEFLANMGYSDYPGDGKFLCETYWNSSMTAMDTLLGIKYVMDTKAPYGYEKLELESPLPAGYSVYENPDAIGLGVLAPANMSDTEYGDDPYENQSILYSAFTGDDTKLYIDSSVNIASQTEENENWTVTAAADGPLYLFVDGSELHGNFYNNNCSLTVNGEKQQRICTRFEINSIYLGEYKSGDVIDVSITRNTSEEGQHQIFAKTLDTEAYKVAAEKLKSAEIENVSANGASLSFTASSEEASTAVLTIPYDTGWAVYVDGEKSDYSMACGALMGISLPAGAHEISMEYSTPGLTAGIAASCLGLLIFMAIKFIAYKRSKKPQAQHVEKK